jgi:hypothetical protein
MNFCKIDIVLDSFSALDESGHDNATERFQFRTFKMIKYDICNNPYGFDYQMSSYNGYSKVNMILLYYSPLTIVFLYKHDMGYVFIYIVLFGT